MAISINHRHSHGTHTTYDVFFYDDTIHTTVTYDPDIAAQWISDVESSNLIVGLDAEWRPSFTRHQQNPVATLQLCIGNRCLVYQLIHAAYIPQRLIDFLDESKYIFVGVGVNSDVKKFAGDYGIGIDPNVVELGKLAASECDRPELKSVGLKALTSFVLGKTMEKPKRVTMSRWDQRRLTEDQVKCMLVWMLMPLLRLAGSCMLLMNDFTSSSMIRLCVIIV